MEFTISRSIDALERTPTILRALLAERDEFWVMRNYGEGTFSPFNVVGHLVDAERTNWMPRAMHILEHGEAPFPLFDRTASGDDVSATVVERLEEFASMRRRSIDDLRALRITPEMLERRGNHPELGAVTLCQLLATWVVHDLHHTAQIAKAMAFQYRDDVGPWAQYLSILPKR